MVRENHLYDILSVDPSVPTEELSRAYKKLALKCHPDKTNHDPVLTEKFKEMTRAYEILKDSSTRRTYDMYGEDGLDQSLNPPKPTRPRASTNAFKAGFHQAHATDHIFSQVFNDINSMFARSANFHFSAGFGMDPMAGMGMGSGSMHGRSSFTFSQPKKTVVPAGFAPLHPRRGNDIHHTCPVELADLYFGRIFKLALPKVIKCGDCSGFGGSDPKSCHQCRGCGSVTTTHYNGDSRFLQTGPCDSCKGKGTIIDSHKMCFHCAGAGYATENKILRVTVLPGMKDGDKIILQREADEGRNIIPGDVIIHIKEVQHPQITRKFNDLYVMQEIDLRTALLGGSFMVKDFLKRGQMLKVFVNAHGHQSLNILMDARICHGEVTGTIKPGEPKIVKGLGMPINRATSHGAIIQSKRLDELPDLREFPKGDLFINFKVAIPSLNDLTNGETDLRLLAAILKPVHEQEPENKDNMMEGFLTNLPSHKNSSSRSKADLSGSTPLEPVELSGEDSSASEMGLAYEPDIIDLNRSEEEEEAEEVQCGLLDIRNSWESASRKRQKL